MDPIFDLFIVLILVAVVITAIVLPIVVLVISLHSRRRISRIENRLERIEAALAGRSVSPPVAEPSPQEPPPEPEIAPPPPLITPSLNAAQLESVIGRRWVGWAAIALILFATAFFLKYAFDNRWIGELGRVGIGVTFGIAMCLAGYRYQQRGWRLFAQILTAGGIALLYLSTYAAFAYYHLVGQTTAFIFLALLIAEAAALSLRYNAPAIAIMALIGGFLTPVLLHSDRDQYRSFFAYIVALDAGALALLKHWRGLSSIAYFGTQLLFWLWYADNYQQQKRSAVLVFQTAIFLLFLLAHFARALIRRDSATGEDAMLLLVNPFVFFATVYFLFNSTHHNWMGAFAIVMALLYGLGAMVMQGRVDDSRREVLLLVSVALTFVTIAIGIQLSSTWITMAWAVEAVAVLWTGLEVRSERLRAQALTLFALACVKFLFWDTPYGFRPSFTPVFNQYFLSSLFVIACFLGAVYLYERATERKLIEPSTTKLVLGFGAAVAFWLLISIETHTFFVGRALTETDPAAIEHERWLGQMALSVLWATYAAALAALGFMRRIAAIRWASLALFALTIIKAMLVDIAQLEQIYRIIVFFVLGVLLLLVAWAYHKAFHSQQA
jgi:uncharacterized membrane protein